jgi:hypothetical protein
MAFIVARREVTMGRTKYFLHGSAGAAAAAVERLPSWPPCTAMVVFRPSHAAPTWATSADAVPACPLLGCPGPLGPPHVVDCAVGLAGPSVDQNPSLAPVNASQNDPALSLPTRCALPVPSPTSCPSPTSAAANPGETTPCSTPCPAARSPSSCGQTLASLPVHALDPLFSTPPLHASRARVSGRSP